jgi:hypothetical protein
MRAGGPAACPKKVNTMAKPDLSDPRAAAASEGAVEPAGGNAETLQVDPERLMVEVNRPRLARMVTISTVLHVLLIGLTSLGFLGLCLKYKTFHPKWEVRRIQKEEADKKAAVEAEKALAEAKRRTAANKAQEAATPKKEATEPGKATPPDTASGTAAPAALKADKPKTKIERDLEEKSNERPVRPSVTLDDVNEAP